MAFYKRSVFLVNPSFQIKFSLLIGSLIFLSSLLYPLLFLDFFKELATTYPEFGSVLEMAQGQFLLFLIFIQFLFSIIVLILFVFFTHKIAGPLYKLKMHLQHIREGEEIRPLTFRDGDYFHDVAEEVSEFLESVALNQESDFKFIEEVRIYLDNLSGIIPEDKKPIFNEISNKLAQIQARYQAPH